MDLRKEFQICKERKTLAIFKGEDKPRLFLETANFPPGFFPRGLLNRQSANLMECPGDLYYVHNPIHRKYTMTMRIEAGPLPTRVPEGSASSTLPVPYPPSFCLFAPCCRFFAVHWISRTRINLIRYDTCGFKVLYFKRTIVIMTALIFDSLIILDALTLIMKNKDSVITLIRV